MLNFPSNPQIDDIFTSPYGDMWYWDGSSWNSLIIPPAQGVQGIQGTSYKTTIGPLPPLNANVGDTWWDSDTGIRYVYYYDGDSYQWVQESIGGSSGTSLTQGSVSTYTSLPGYPSSYTGYNGDTYITSDTGHLWTWNGTTWVDNGSIIGSQGTRGVQGIAGIGVQGTSGSGSGSSSQGIQGTYGTQGTVGTGTQGTQGATGATGASGSSGTVITKVKTSDTSKTSTNTADKITDPHLTVAGLAGGYYKVDMYLRPFSQGFTWAFETGGSYDVGGGTIFVDGTVGPSCILATNSLILTTTFTAYDVVRITGTLYLGSSFTLHWGSGVNGGTTVLQQYSYMTLTKLD